MQRATINILPAPPTAYALVRNLYDQISTKEALEGKHVAYYFSSRAVEEQLEKAAEGQETVRPTPIVKEVGGGDISTLFLCSPVFWQRGWGAGWTGVCTRPVNCYL